MTGYQSIGFHEALETAESLPTTQQENLVEIIRRRLIESKRDSISRNIQVAKEEYAGGEAETGVVDDRMKALNVRQSAPRLTDLCHVDGEHCFSSVEEVDEFIRGLRNEWP
uniref:Uncharacterized protein n=1 Tax=Candidatus Kentrum sp. SD TaxID=2126332 RepID=A0A451BL01_9GAMM|nr:MAG: hypothetical protein BECKSD772D_GA0070982_10313 [Candidatus Kentron sp. SD]